MSLFDRAVRSTASTLRINGQILSEGQIAALTQFLRDNGLEDDAANLLASNEAKLAPKSVYVVYSGADAGSRAGEYVRSSAVPAGTIGDTDYGKELR